MYLIQWLESPQDLASRRALENRFSLNLEAIMGFSLWKHEQVTLPELDEMWETYSPNTPI